MRSMRDRPWLSVVELVTSLPPGAGRSESGRDVVSARVKDRSMAPDNEHVRVRTRFETSC